MYDVNSMNNVDEINDLDGTNVMIDVDIASNADTTVDVDIRNNCDNTKNCGENEVSYTLWSYQTIRTIFLQNVEKQRHESFQSDAQI